MKPIASLKKNILTLLSRDPKKRFSTKVLAKRLRIKARHEYEDLLEAIADLQREGCVAADLHGSVRYVARRPDRGPRSHLLQGVLTVTKRGPGFVRVEGKDEEIAIAPDRMGTALHGDTVSVAPFAAPVRRRVPREQRRVEGEIVAVIRRRFTTLVGTLHRTHRTLFVIPDDERIPRDIYVAEEETQGAREGDKVCVELMPWEDAHRNPEGKIVEVLGPSGDPRVEVLSVAHMFGLPLHFPRAALQEADALEERPQDGESSSRRDLRNVACITIDPTDAKDFDDAVSCEPLDGHGWRVGVHIADVSHYVREGSALDREAYLRGTSVYLANQVVPMLPERLSNELCSLRPHVDRLTYSVIMDVDSHGTVATYTITPSVIHSARRFTYEEAQEIIQRGEGEFGDVLLPLVQLSRVLYRKRRSRGSIDFDMPEAKFSFDEEGLPSQIHKKERLDSNRLIEECMLLANKTVARHIAPLKSGERERPFIYRVHDAPDPGRLADLARFVRQFGYSLDVQSGVSARALQKLLDSVKGSEVENVINEVALRSMAKAVYSEKNIGHYGLGFPYYTHFTSPIRRYPDLMVHRLLREYARGLTDERRSDLAHRLPAVCRQSSDQERLAMEAERASVKVMQVEYMKRHIGDEFDGVIVGVTDFGLFVEINDLLVEGLIPVRDLMDDYYMFDEQHYSLRGRSRGKTYRLGDVIRISVAAVDPEKRTIDFALARGGERNFLPR